MCKVKEAANQMKFLLNWMPREADCKWEGTWPGAWQSLVQDAGIRLAKCTVWTVHCSDNGMISWRGLQGSYLLILPNISILSTLHDEYDWGHYTWKGCRSGDVNCWACTSFYICAMYVSLNITCQWKRLSVDAPPATRVVKFLCPKVPLPWWINTHRP